MYSKLGEYVLDVIADRRLGEEESLGYRGAIEALCQELKDFTLPRREDIEPVINGVGTRTRSTQSLHDHALELRRKCDLPDEMNQPALTPKLQRRNDRRRAQPQRLAGSGPAKHLRCVNNLVRLTGLSGWAQTAADDVSAPISPAQDLVA